MMNNKNKPKRKRQPQGKTKRKRFGNQDDYPYPVCDGTEFEWGWLTDTGAFTTSRIPFKSWRQFRARACQTCGNILLFLDE